MSDRALLSRDTSRPGTYEVYIDVRHHKRHLDEWEERESTALKLVDSGNPRQMVLDALRGFADELEERWAREDQEQAERGRREAARAAWEEKQAARRRRS